MNIHYFPFEIVYNKLLNWVEIEGGGGGGHGGGGTRVGP